MQIRRPLTLAAALAPGAPLAVLPAALALALPGGLPGAHAAALDCYATDAVNADRWADAEAELRRALTDPTCRADREGIRYSLAHAIERQADATPARACDAERHYREVATSGADPALTDPARAAADRMARACLAATPVITPPPPGDPAPPPVEPTTPDRTAAWLTTAGAVIAAGAGATLLYLGVEADGERQTAEDELRAARAAAKAKAEAELDPTAELTTYHAAVGRFEDAADRATVLGLTGWASVALAVGLGATATWLWIDDDAAVTVGPGVLGVSARF